MNGLSNVKEEVYGALDSFIAWELEFPLIVVKKALKTLEFQKEWKRIIQVSVRSKHLFGFFSFFLSNIFLVLASQKWELNLLVNHDVVVEMDA